MPRRVLLPIIGGVVILIGIPLVILTVGRTTAPTPTPLPTQNTPQPSSSESSLFPIKPTDPSVTNVWINYTLISSVKQITTTPRGTNLILASYNIILPPLPISDETQIILTKNRQRQNISASEIKQGAQVQVIARFDVLKSDWTVYFINVIETSSVSEGASLP